MQLMRDILRKSLAASLSNLSPLDRLSAAWPVVAGHSIAERSHIASYEDGIVAIAADTHAWHRQLQFLREQLRGDLARVSRVRVIDILLVRPAPEMPTETDPHGLEEPRKST